MIQKQINLPIPLWQIKQTFTIPIYKIKSVNNFNYRYYEAITVYGTMCLVIESYRHNQMLQLRNKLIRDNCDCFPLIFQQHILQKPMQIICLTLTQKCVPLSQWLSIDSPQLKPTIFAKLIRSVDLLQNHKLKLKPQFISKQLLYLSNSQQICLDFTIVNIQQLVEKDEQISHIFDSMVQKIVNLLFQKYNTNKKIQQIIFIQGQIYTFQPHKLKQAKNCFQLLMFLNVCPNFEVNLLSRQAKQQLQLKKSFEQKRKTLQLKQDEQPPKYISPSKRKRATIKSLQGNPLIQYNDRTYENFVFIQGKCTNCLKQVFYQQLSNKFIKDNSLYKLQQFQHLIVHISENHSQRKQQTITVYPPVSKVQLISFLIAYVKCVNPIIKSIVYYQPQNTLKLQFQNRRKDNKILNIIFYEEYVVKDQQISMILQKSILHQCKIDLRKMKISDGFLVFLAHSQKSKDISSLNLSDNYGLSDIGLSTFLLSAQSNNLKTFSLTALNAQSPLLQQSIQIIQNKSSLSKLYLKKFNPGSSTMGDQINVSKLSLVQLQSIGIRVSLSNLIKANLKILRLDQYVSIQQLKNILHLSLSELKIRLQQAPKKSLMDSISNFSSFSTSITGVLRNDDKSNFTKLFAQGKSNKTLKILDLSFSNSRYRTIRPLFIMPQLQKLILDNCVNLGNQFASISPKILSLSLTNVDLLAQQVYQIVAKTKVLIQLNITNTKIQKHEIVKLLNYNKLYITNLIVSQYQYTNKLLEQSNGYQLIQCIQVYIDRLLQPEQEYSFNYLIMKVSQANKTLRFIVSLQQTEQKEQIQKKKQILIDKIKKYIIISCSNLEKLNNIYINKTKVSELLQIQQDLQIEDSCQSQVASSIIIGADRCYIRSQPKIIINKNSHVPVRFRILEQETIDRFVHRFVKYVHSNNLLMAIDLSNNKLISKQIIIILLSYGKFSIKQISFTGCMFNFNQIADWLFQFQVLNEINDGHYEILLNKQNFNMRSQKYLKLFMRSKSIRELKIQCEQIEQVQIMFSVLSHIVDLSSTCLQSFTLTFSQIKINKQCQHFFGIVFNLFTLRKFQFTLRDCIIKSASYSQIWQRGINKLKNLQVLVLSLPYYNFPIINLDSLVQVNLQILDGKAQQNSINKCIRNLPTSKNLKSFKLSLPNCPEISSVTRLFSSLPMGNIFQNMLYLQHLCVNFQYCQIKQQPLYDFISTITQFKNLKMFELNVSFAINNIGQLVTNIQKISQQFKNRVSVKIICVTQNSRNYVLKNDALSQKGIEIIL